jgi:hypothetical protein
MFHHLPLEDRCRQGLVIALSRRHRRTCIITVLAA